MATPQRFSADIRRAVNQAGENMEQATRGALLELTSKVILRTPVDTGRARGNWQASINSPEQSTVAKASASGGSAIADAQSAINAAPGNVYYLTNNLPYIQRLEFEVWSRQAPNGMVRISLREMGIVFEQEAAEVRRRSGA